jgi:hypothetical protein
VALPNSNVWRDVDGWGAPQYYRTIQLGDVDGDGRMEIVGRASNGVNVLKFTPPAVPWSQFPRTVPFLDSQNWNQPQYYETIRTGDIDGDGRAEILGRSAQGVLIYKYDPSTRSFLQMPDGPPWTDSSGWAGVEYYDTIRLADVDGDGQQELLARDAYAMEVWKYGVSTQSSSKTDASYPQFTGGQEVAYAYLNANLPEVDPLVDLRQQYGNTDPEVLLQWAGVLENGSLAQPANVSPGHWMAVTNQILKEVQHVLNVDTFFAQAQNVYSTVFALDNNTVNSIAAALQADQSSDSSAVVLIQAFIGALVALSALVSLVAAPEVAVAASVLVGLMAAGSTLLGLTTSSGNVLDLTYAQLLNQLRQQYLNFLNVNAGIQAEIVADYGLLLAVGGQTTTSNIDSAAIIQTASTAYAVWVWQSLTPLVWVAESTCYPPKNYPSPSQFIQTINQRCVNGDFQNSTTSYWIGIQGSFLIGFPSVQNLMAITGPPPNGLGVPIGDLLFGRNGWHMPVGHDDPGSTGARPPRRRKPVPVPLVAVGAEAMLLRPPRPRPGLVDLLVTVTNLGLTPLRNVDIRGATLDGTGTISPLPTQQHRLAPGGSALARLSFRQRTRRETPSTNTLRLLIRHRGGTFRLQVKVMPAM